MIVAITHHKAGSALSLKIFRSIEKICSKEIWYSFYDPVEFVEEKKWDICFNQHARVYDVLQSIEGCDVKGWRCIRHPKALVYSASLYHLKCKEPWVDIPLNQFDERAFFAFTDGATYKQIISNSLSPSEKLAIIESVDRSSLAKWVPRYAEPIDFGGKTYREMLGDLNNAAERLSFEMRAYSYGVVQEMLAFPSAGFFSVSLEALSHQSDMLLFEQSLKFLGFDTDQIARVKLDCERHFLWSDAPLDRPEHITTGVSDEWKRVFDPALDREFDELFPDSARFDDEFGYLWS